MKEERFGCISSAPPEPAVIDPNLPNCWPPSGSHLLLFPAVENSPGGVFSAWKQL